MSLSAPVADSRQSPRSGSDHTTPGGLIVSQESARAVRRLQRAPRVRWAQAAAVLPAGLPQTWCGTPTGVDRPTLASQRGLPTIHVIYAHTDDLAGRAPFFSTLLQADVSRIAGVVAERSGHRKTLRFDMGTECGPEYVDIQLLRLPGTREDYLTGPTTQYPDDRWPSMAQPRLSDAIQTAIKSQTPGGAENPALPKRNFLVYIDGLNIAYHRGADGAWLRTDYDWHWGAASSFADDRPDPDVQLNVSEHGLVAEIYGASPQATPSGFPVADPAAGSGPAMVLHELFHTLGAVQRSAPNATDGMHCRDGQDVMCYRDSDAARSIQLEVCPLLSDPSFPQEIDCNEDDYFSPDPAPGSYLTSHWNTFDSPFLASCAELVAACRFEDRSTAADRAVPLAGDAGARRRSAASREAPLRIARTGGPASAAGDIRLTVGRGIRGRTVATATAARGARISRVSFYADGRWVATRRHPRFSVALPAHARYVSAKSVDAGGHRFATAATRLPRHLHRTRSARR